MSLSTVQYRALVFSSSTTWTARPIQAESPRHPLSWVIVSRNSCSVLEEGFRSFFVTVVACCRDGCVCVDDLFRFFRRLLSAFDTRLRGMVGLSDRDILDISAVILCGCMSVLFADDSFVDFDLFLLVGKFLLEICCCLLRG